MGLAATRGEGGGPNVWLEIGRKVRLTIGCSVPDRYELTIQNLYRTNTQGLESLCNDHGLREHKAPPLTD